MKTDRWPGLLTDVLVATSLLTRLPLPHLDETAFKHSARATWAYPAAGLLIGAAAAGVGYVSLGIGLPVFAAAGLVVATLMIVTGAMHEDGLADVADGFWGGFTRERRLEIMKDSQIGTYGTLALIVTTGIRWSAYAFLLQQSWVGVVAVAVLSRSTMPLIMCALPHARHDGLSHRVGRPVAAHAIGAAAIGMLIGFLLLGWITIAITLIVGATAAVSGWLAQRKIGGQTGDVLGATQQMTEITALLTLTALQ